MEKSEEIALQKEEIKKQSSFMVKMISSLKDWFEINLTIKLFGVEVFTFNWPPKN